MGCPVPFPVQWYHFHLGVGGVWGHAPLDFIFNFCKMKNGVSYYTCSWDAMHLFQSSGTIIMWRGERRGGGGGLGTCPPPDFKKVFAKWKMVFSHITYAHGMLCNFLLVQWYHFHEGGRGIWGHDPPRFFKIFPNKKWCSLSHYTWMLRIFPSPLVSFSSWGGETGLSGDMPLWIFFLKILPKEKWFSF